MVRRARQETQTLNPDFIQRLDRLIRIALVSSLISAGGAAAGLFGEADSRGSTDPEVRSYFLSEAAQQDIRAVQLQFAAGNVPEDLTILFDDVERYFATELGRALQDTLTMSADLPAEEAIRGLTDGQQRDAAVAAHAIANAGELIESERRVQWGRIPPNTRQAMERNRSLGLGGAVGTLLFGLLALAAHFQKKHV